MWVPTFPDTFCSICDWISPNICPPMILSPANDDSEKRVLYTPSSPTKSSGREPDDWSRTVDVAERSHTSDWNHLLGFLVLLGRLPVNTSVLDSSRRLGGAVSECCQLVAGAAGRGLARGWVGEGLWGAADCEPARNWLGSPSWRAGGAGLAKGWVGTGGYLSFVTLNSAIHFRRLIKIPTLTSRVSLLFGQ